MKKKLPFVSLVDQVTGQPRLCHRTGLSRSAGAMDALATEERLTTKVISERLRQLVGPSVDLSDCVFLGAVAFLKSVDFGSANISDAAFVNSDVEGADLSKAEVASLGDWNGTAWWKAGRVSLLLQMLKEDSLPTGDGEKVYLARRKNSNATPYDPKNWRLLIPIKESKKGDVVHLLASAVGSKSYCLKVHFALSCRVLRWQRRAGSLSIGGDQIGAAPAQAICTRSAGKSGTLYQSHLRTSAMLLENLHARHTDSSSLASQPTGVRAVRPLHL